MYGRAVESFGQELGRVDASIESIRSGRFLKALVREEIRQDKDWVIRLRTLPETPETYYLMTLMASHDFQTALQNYLDLDDVRRKLLAWQGSFDAYEDMIRLRRDDFDNPDKLARLSRSANLTPEEFRREFESVVANEPPPLAIDDHGEAHVHV